MIRRCYTPSHGAYYKYGAKGIRVCRRWRKSFLTFVADVGKRPSLKHSLDRKDGRKGYHPSNVRWVTFKEQSNNRRNTRFVMYKNEQMPFENALALAGNLVNRSTAAHRLRNGWNVEQAITIPADARFRSK